jgi:hypothetical protein
MHKNTFFRNIYNLLSYLKKYVLFVRIKTKKLYFLKKIVYKRSHLPFSLTNHLSVIYATTITNIFHGLVMNRFNSKIAFIMMFFNIRNTHTHVKCTMP